MHALIFADNKYQTNRLGVLRAPGAHRIATLLRSQNVQTEVIDFYLDWTLEELKQAIDLQLAKPTLFIGFSCSLMFDGIDNFTAVRDYIRSKDPTVAIVIGGFHTTQKGFEGADWYVEGYGEYATLALVDYLQGKTADIKYELDAHGHKVIYTKEHYPVNKLTSLVTEYTPGDFIAPTETLSIETARGCVFKCKFCSFQLLGKSRVDYLRDTDEIRREFITNYEQYGTTKYIVTEDTFNDTDEKVDMLYTIVKSLPFKLEFMGYLRADLLAAKPDNLRKLVDCGFTSMHFGIETFNDDAGKVVGKGMSGDKLKQALIKFKQDYPQIYTNGTFIIGLPGESADEIRATAEWILESKTLDFWTFNPLMIPKKNKLIYSSEFTDNYLMYGYSKISSEQIAAYAADESRLLFANKVLPYIIQWKNQHFDYYTAAELAVELNQSANLHKKLDAWTTFAISGLGYDLSAVQTHTYSGENPLDQQLINSQSNQFIQSYKQQKLKYLTEL
jgi:radical SAM superfamily enzyme